MIAWYALYRFGLAPCPRPWETHYEPGLAFLDRLFRWSRGIAILGGEHCPSRGPTIVASNHQRLDDPFVTIAAAAKATGGRARIKALMRDDFFRVFPDWMVWFVKPNVMFNLIGGFPITRGAVGDEQLDPAIDHLDAGHSLLTYPGRSRTRNGQFIEYRDWIRSPGRTSLLVSRVQDRQPGRRMATVPSARTYNPATGGGAVVFGPALFLEPGAGPVEQRAFDFDLVVSMSDLVCINATHVVAGLLYLHCLHARPGAVAVDTLVDAARRILEAAQGRYVDPAAMEDTPGEVRAALQYFARGKQLAVQDGIATLDREAILTVPGRDLNYREVNPVKYCVNQIMHLADVVALIESEGTLA